MEHLLEVRACGFEEHACDASSPPFRHGEGVRDPRVPSVAGDDLEDGDVRAVLRREVARRSVRGGEDTHDDSVRTGEGADGRLGSDGRASPGREEERVHRSAVAEAEEHDERRSVDPGRSERHLVVGEVGLLGDDPVLEQVVQAAEVDRCGEGVLAQHAVERIVEAHLFEAYDANASSGLHDRDGIVAVLHDGLQVRQFGEVALRDRRRLDAVPEQDLLILQGLLRRCGVAARRPSAGDPARRVRIDCHAASSFVVSVRIS